MRRWIVSGTMAALALATAGLVNSTGVYAAAKKRTGDVEEAAVRSVAGALTTAWRKKDVDGVIRQFADDPTIMAPHGPVIRSKTEMRSFLTEIVKDPGFSLDMIVDKVAVSTSHDLAYSRGTYTLRMTDPKTTGVIHSSGSFVSVFRKEPDGSWKVIEDISAPGPDA